MRRVPGHLYKPIENDLTKAIRYNLSYKKKQTIELRINGEDTTGVKIYPGENVEQNEIQYEHFKMVMILDIRKTSSTKNEQIDLKIVDGGGRK